MRGSLTKAHSVHEVFPLLFPGGESDRVELGIVVLIPETGEPVVLVAGSE
jgi:hypothetical protein